MAIIEEITIALNDVPPQALYIWPQFLKRINVDLLLADQRPKLVDNQMPRGVDIGDALALDQIDILTWHRINLTRNRNEFVNYMASKIYRSSASTTLNYGHVDMSVAPIKEFVRRAGMFNLKPIANFLSPGLYVIVMGRQQKTQLLKDPVFVHCVGIEAIERMKETQCGHLINFNQCALYVDSEDTEVQGEPGQKYLEAIAFAADPIDGSDFPVAQVFSGEVEAFTTQGAFGKCELNWRAKELYAATELLDGITAAKLSEITKDSFSPILVAPDKSRAIHRIWTGR